MRGAPSQRPAPRQSPREGARDEAVALLHVVQFGQGRASAFPVEVRLASDRPVVIGREGQLRTAPDDRLASARHARIFSDARGRLFVEDLGSRVGLYRRIVGLFRLDPGARIRFRDQGYCVVAGGLEHEPLDPSHPRPRPVGRDDLSALAVALGPTLRRGESLIGDCPEALGTAAPEAVYERIGERSELHVGDEIAIGGLVLRVLAPRARRS